MALPWSRAYPGARANPSAGSEWGRHFNPIRVFLRLLRLLAAIPSNPVHPSMSFSGVAAGRRPLQTKCLHSHLYVVSSPRERRPGAMLHPLAFASRRVSPPNRTVSAPTKTRQNTVKHALRLFTERQKHATKSNEKDGWFLDRTEAATANTSTGANEGLLPWWKNRNSLAQRRAGERGERQPDISRVSRAARANAI